MNETAKANERRKNDPLFQRVFTGKGIDIGAGKDNLAREGLFPNIETCEDFDTKDGDAQSILEYKTKNTYDFVYSSHCLEHLSEPAKAIKDWFSLVKTNGYMVIVVPDVDLYEQGIFPSLFNREHKWTFTLWKDYSWCNRSINLIELIQKNLSNFKIIHAKIVDTNYDYKLTTMRISEHLMRTDQTNAHISGVGHAKGFEMDIIPAEVSVEIVIQKMPLYSQVLIANCLD